MRLRDLFFKIRCPEVSTMAPELRRDPSAVPDETGLPALVLVHGHYWKDAAGMSFDPSERSFLFEPLRRDPRFAKLRERYRVYRYLYPTHAGYGFSATALATALREELPRFTGRRDLTIVAHSMGGLVARHAIQHHGIGERIDKLITLATPHHGTILASVVLADRRIRRFTGRAGYLAQRLAGRIWQPTPAMLGMRCDGRDSSFTQQQREEFGLHPNEELAHLNRTDRYLDRLICVMGRVTGLWLRGRTLWDQIPRWFMGRHDKRLLGLDPLVQLESGLAEHLSVRSRHVLDGLDHQGIVTSPESQSLLFELLEGAGSRELETAEAAA